MGIRAGARGLLVISIGISALVGGTGVAHADPDGAPPPAPTIDQLLLDTPENPSVFANPADRGRPVVPNWDGFGMYCQNLYVKCR
jgi:hypothetical protein